MQKEVAVPTPDKIVISARRQSEPTREIAAPDTRGDRQGSLVGIVTEVFKMPSLDGIDKAQVNSLFTKVPDTMGRVPGRGSIVDDCSWGECGTDGEKCPK